MLEKKTVSEGLFNLYQDTKTGEKQREGDAFRDIIY